MTMTSIIIPTYNRLGLLRSCVESIRAHTRSAYEIIVVDNASNDGTEAYCRASKLTLISSRRTAVFRWPAISGCSWLRGGTAAVEQ